MNITIQEQHTLKRAVSARELYDFLEVGCDFTTWCKRMFEYDFEENIDYMVFVKNDVNPISLGGRPSKDYMGFDIMSNGNETKDCTKLTNQGVQNERIN